jgi:oxygen-dependent protoporphyrinogen oxidase
LRDRNGQGGIDVQEKNPIPMPRIAVVGGGLTGLAAAFWLTRLLPRASVTLFESRDALGGLVGTRSVRGRLIETGPLAFPAAAPATSEFMEACGLWPFCEKARLDAGIGLWVGSRIAAFSRSAAGILKARLLTPSGLIRLLAEPFIPRGAARDESVRDFFRRRTGAAFMDAIMEPMSSGILAGDPAAMSMAANYPMLWTMEKRWGSLGMGFWKKRRASRPGSGRNAQAPSALAAGTCGNRAVVEAIADELGRKGVAIRTSVRVDAIRRAAGGAGWTLTCGSVESGFDGIIACIPPGGLAALCDSLAGESRRFLEGIPYASVSLGYLSYRKTDLARGFQGAGCLVQGKSGTGILSLFFPSRMFRGRCPEDEEMVRVMAGGQRFQAAAELEEGAFRDLASGAAARILDPGGTPIDFTRITLPQALPQLVVGHKDGVEKALASLKRELPGLIPAGTGYAGAGIENAVKEGKRAAAEMAAALRP